jgi:uncharacterized OB-fold protein
LEITMPQGTSDYTLPLPTRRGFAEDFYRFCKLHELRFQRCQECGTWRHGPREMCARCNSFKWEWAKSSGKGKIFSFTTVHQAMLPEFADHLPYNIVVVEMEEGVRILSWPVDLAADELRLDLPVEVVFDDVTAEVTLPKFRRAG